ncbi:hypothetical protein IPF37_00025 [bacterium]|nr:MAG: hypothetical protein IPF37_00025 [bacterium]
MLRCYRTKNAQPYRHFFGNTQQLEKQKDTILEDHQLVKIQKEQIKKDAAQKELLAQQEEILAQARIIENERRFSIETATDQETEKQNKILAEAQKIHAARKVLEKEKTREKLTTNIKTCKNNLINLIAKIKTSFLGFNLRTMDANAYWCNGYAKGLRNLCNH